jgi:MGT family glycosyltransferase
MRALVGALGWTGHTYPALALARELHGRGHEVAFEAPESWREVAEAEGLDFHASVDQMAWPGRPQVDPDAPELVDVVRQRAPEIRELAPDVVVSDVLTLVPALAAESAGIPTATIVPHLYPVRAPDHPFFPWGLHLPRTPVGRAAWRAFGGVQPRLDPRLRGDRRRLDALRRELGLPALRRYHGAISDRLTLVGTFPQLEYPREWPRHVHVTGPLLYDLDDSPGEIPGGDEPLVFIHSSTAQDPELKLIRAGLEALADEPVRVVATMSRRGHEWEGPVPGNAVVEDWVAYEQVLPRASVVVCSGGHGAVTKILATGTPLLICPPGADMAENGARVAWAGAGLTVPGGLVAPGPLRWAIRRLLSEPRFTDRAREIAEWSRGHDGPATAAGLVEGLASSNGGPRS